MNIYDLMAEAEALRKPCVYLTSKNKIGDIVGYWGGERKDLSERVSAHFRMRHRMTLSETLLQDKALDLYAYRNETPIGLYMCWRPQSDEDEIEDAEFQLRHERDAFAALECTGEPLCAVWETSLPPFPALCLYGGEIIANWLQEQGFKRYDYWRIYGDLLDEYEAEYLEQRPVHRTEMDVIVGGWPMEWPDTEYYPPYEHVHLFTTLRDAEPWIEGWYGARGGGMSVRERIT